MGGGQNLLKISAPLHLIKIYHMRPLLAWSILQDSTFNLIFLYLADSKKLVIHYYKEYWAETGGENWMQLCL